MREVISKRKSQKEGTPDPPQGEKSVHGSAFEANT
jgi:hypothetical protein